MDYSNASTFVSAYITPSGQLFVMDQKGQRIRRPEKDPKEQRDILEEFELKWRFASAGPDWVFNPSFVTKIHYDNNHRRLVIASSKREWMNGRTLSPEAAVKQMQRLESEGYVPWPGKRMFHRDFIRSMHYDDKLESLVMQDQALTNYEALLSYEDAARYLRAFQPEAFDKQSDKVAIPTPQAVPEREREEAPRRELNGKVLETLASRLKSAVIGQDPAADALVDALEHNVSGLGEENKPIGSFLFLGPTGVGKTEVSKQLAKIMDLPFKKLDMSEYQESHNVARLVGSPPGYKDSERGGDLTNFVRQANGPCVVLLDEVEKAHPDVCQLLLQIFDDARITDGMNNTADCRNVIFIMTSNLGTGLQQKKSSEIGFTARATQQDDDPRNDRAVRSYFSLELLNRIDAIVRFQSLQPEHMKQITSIFLKNLVNKKGMKNVLFSIAPKAEDYLAEKGHDPEFGARPLKRLIVQEIEQKLAKELLYGALKNGGSVSVDLDQDKRKLELTFNAAAIANDNRPKTPPVVAPAKVTAALLMPRAV